jgi:hypothetical protein
VHGQRRKARARLGAQHEHLLLREVSLKLLEVLGVHAEGEEHPHLK